MTTDANPPAKRRLYVPTGRPPGRPKGSRTRPKPEQAPSSLVKPAAMRPETAAAYLGVSCSTIRKLVRQGKLEARNIGTCRIVLTSSLDRLLEGGA
jgi:excisionase family DNA binding protein